MAKLHAPSPPRAAQRLTGAGAAGENEVNLLGFGVSTVSSRAVYEAR